VSSVTRTRDRISAILLILLGAWGGMIPFVGPYFGYAFTPDTTWTYTTGRLWLSILPGAAVFLGGLLVLPPATRPAAKAGGYLAAIAGAWFVVGSPIMALVAVSGSSGPGLPAASPGSAFSAPVMRLLEGLGFYLGLGVVIVFLAAAALGRLAGVTLSRSGYADTPAELAPERERYHPV
jgi:hypothetical protein